MSKFIEISLTPLIFSGSGLAVRCDVGALESVWLPLSHFQFPPEEDDLGVDGTYDLSEWICEQKDLL